MQIRPYKIADFEDITNLFYQSVHSVCIKDYTEKELDAWAPKDNDYSHLKEALRENKVLIAEEDGIIVGFGDISKDGYLDHLFVHKDYQKRGIATALCDELEKGFDKITVNASKTAKPFFIKREYRIEREQQVLIRGIYLTNYAMKKGQEKPAPKNDESKTTQTELDIELQC